MKESREKTIEEVKDDILGYIKINVQYWEKFKNEKMIKEMLEGIVFSILVMFDGEGELPAMDIIIKPHPDDKDYLMERDENWYLDGMIIGDGDLHELWSRYK